MVEDMISRYIIEKCGYSKVEITYMSNLSSCNVDVRFNYWYDLDDWEYEDHLTINLWDIVALK